MILYIDTTSEVIIIRLIDRSIKPIDELSFLAEFNLSEQLLFKIKSILLKNHIIKKDLSLIAVNSGPGSYTGLRIGITTANLLAFSLDIPVVEVISSIDSKKIKNLLVNKMFTSPVLPNYGRPPHITKKKYRL